MLKRWSQPNGYRQVLAIGLPLVASFGTTSLIHFTDRVFLSNYAVDAIAAALPAGITSFLFLGFFMGVASYVNVFVAQYLGAGMQNRVGAALWQGIYFSLGAAVILASLYFLAEPLFMISGHPREIQHLEVTYFRILILGSGLVVMATSLSCFFSGQGLTRPVMMVNFVGAAVNIPLDYLLINGVGFFPEMGIAGAGLATVISQTVMVLLFGLCVFNHDNNIRFGVWRARAFDGKLFKRLMRFGLPGGIQFFLDIFAITFFIFMVGRLGRAELAASNIVFAISTMAFLPLVGFSIAVSTMVGQAIGARRPQDAVKATGSTLHVCLVYVALVATVFVFAPQWLLEMFRTRGGDVAAYGEIMDLGVVLLRFVAAYILFDALLNIYFGALKGAGDIYFVMWAISIVSVCLMIVPLFVGIEFFGVGIYYTWCWLTAYIATLGLIFRWRYRRGKWQSMRVIEIGASQLVNPEGLP